MRRLDGASKGGGVGFADVGASNTATETTIAPEKVEVQKGWGGQSVRRKEDKRLLQGEGVFVDDVKRHGMGYLHFVRSPYAHAHITRVDVDYEPLPAVVDARKAQESEAPMLHDDAGGNLMWTGLYSWGDLDTAFV